MTLSTYWHDLIEFKTEYAPFEVKVDYTYEEEPLEESIPRRE
jgi:hypothetical protein